MNPNQALWEKGDFTRIAASMRGSGEALVARSVPTSVHVEPAARAVIVQRKVSAER